MRDLGQIHRRHPFPSGTPRSLSSAASPMLAPALLRTVRQSGQTRFSAVCMLAAYPWLGIAGLLMLVAPPGTTTFSYDATVHAVTLGFILSMIFGHAPIILPAVTGLRITYSALLYGPIALLHISVASRVIADLFEWN